MWEKVHGWVFHNYFTYQIWVRLIQSCSSSSENRKIFLFWNFNEICSCGFSQQLDMSTLRRRLKSPQSLSGTSAHPTMVTLVNIMVMNGWLASFSFHVNRPSHSWDKAISDSDLEISTPRSRSWVWSKGKVIQSAQYHINWLRFHFTSIRPTIPEIELFRNWPWNIQGQGHEWGQRSRSHIVPSIQPMHFLFVSHQSDQPFLRYGQNSVWPWKNTSEISKENLQK